MKINTFLLLLLFSTNIQYLLAGEIRDKSESIINTFAGHEAILRFQKLVINPKQKKEIENQVRQRFLKNFVYVWKINQGDSLKGYAVLDNVYGKSMPITFLVVFDTTGKILETNIIKYREAYGGQISNPSWLKQFTGKTIESDFKKGKDIDAISGATISVNAITKGIKKLVLLFPYIQISVN
jgi:Na+-translocating ferredoxin:NAD+ oxidoreductase RnfG subunit